MKKKNDYITKFLEKNTRPRQSLTHPWKIGFSDAQLQEKMKEIENAADKIKE